LVLYHQPELCFKTIQHMEVYTYISWSTTMSYTNP